MRLRAGWFRDPVVVATATGAGAYGTTLAEPITVYGDVSGDASMVRNAVGVEVLSQQSMRFPPAAATDTGRTVDPLQVFTPESEVTVRGQTALVVRVKPHTVRGAVVYVTVLTT